MKKKTICLNMIVKNEAHIIKDTLNHLQNIFKFDYWVICDTGSTDDTIEIIETYFKTQGISGELVTHKWEGFDVCRTYALNCAYNKTDYLLIFDADDRICGNFELPDNRNLTKDKYYLKSGNVNIIYHRPLLINNTIKWCFKGVLHEYLQNIDSLQNGEQHIDGDYFIESCGTGSRSINPNKYYEDALLLERYIDIEKDDGLRSRYIYYCAQSYYDAKKYVKSIEFYKKSLSQHNWYQEKYVACMRIGDMLIDTENTTEAIIYWDGASQFDQTRLECVGRIIRYFYAKGNHHMVMYYYKKYKHIPQIKDLSGYLLIDTNAYNWMRYFACISSYYINDTFSGYNCCKYLIINSINIDEINVLKNLSFYISEFKNDITDEDSKKQLLICIFNKMKQYVNINNDLVKQIWEYIKDYLKNHLFELYENGKNIMSITQPSKIIVDNKYKDSKNLLFYVGYSNEHWNYSFLSKEAIGGSEKAVAYLSYELNNLLNNDNDNDNDNDKWTIYIAGDVKEEILQNGKIVYIPFDKIQNLLNTTEFHTIIISRYIAFLEIFNSIKTNQLYLWAHDSTFLSHGCNLTSDEIIHKYNDSITGCICLTNWHKHTIVNDHSLLGNKITIINNGIVGNLIQNNPIHEKYKYSFIYSSCAERGLETLLTLWTDIKKNIPIATLHICSYNDFPINDNDTKLKQIIDNDESIIHYGKLNTTELYTLMSKCEFWLYPTTFNETSCITAFEMLAHNILCLYYPVAGLIDTIGDYGLKVQNGTEIETILNLKIKDEIEIRKKGKQYAMECSWINRAKCWIEKILLHSH